MVDIVQSYDPEKDVWAKTFSLPAALGGIRACTLTILSSFANTRGSSTHGGSSTTNINSAEAAGE